MNISLISATSIFALLAAAVSPGHAAELLAAPDRTNIYDLVHDDLASADGGHSTASKVDRMIVAVAALESTTVGWQASSFTGPVDLTTSASVAFPRVPLGAAPGTRPHDDFATPISGAWQWNAVQKAHAIGVARIAPLIGTIGSGPPASDKSVSTVFVAEGSRPGFGYGSLDEGGGRSSSVATAYGPGSTSTATITVAGAGNFRQRGEPRISVAAANNLSATPPASDPAPRAVAMTDAAAPTLGYNYAPATPGTKGNAVEASFSAAVTANGTFAQNNAPVLTNRIQSSELPSGHGQSVRAANGKTQTSDVATIYARLIDLAQPIAGNATSTRVDGTRTFLSASVSAHPSTTAALYIANVVNAAPTVSSAQTIDAFQVGPTPGRYTRAGSATSVPDPISGRIMGSVGPLNNSLALP